MMPASTPLSSSSSSNAISGSQPSTPTTSSPPKSTYDSLRRKRHESPVVNPENSLSSSFSHLTIREKIDQAVGLVMWFNTRLRDNAMQPLNLSGRVKNLKDIKNEPLSIPSIISEKYSLQHEALIFKVQIHPNEIIEMMELINNRSISDEDAKIKFDKFVDLLVRSLADLSPSGVELNRLNMPTTLGALQKPPAQELQLVLKKAKEAKKIYVAIATNHTAMERKRLLKFSIESGTLRASIKVKFFTSQKHDSQYSMDPNIKLPPLPKRLDISLLWNKRNGDKIDLAIEGVSVYLSEIKDSTDQNKSTLRALVREWIIDISDEKETSKIVPPNSSKPTWDNNSIRDCFRKVCGEEIFDDAKNRMKLHEQTLLHYGIVRKRSKSMEELTKAQADLIVKQINTPGVE